jgi:hypothetical protein
VEQIGRYRTRNHVDSGVLNRMVIFRCSPVLRKKLNGKKKN